LVEFDIIYQSLEQHGQTQADVQIMIYLVFGRFDTGDILNQRIGVTL